MWRNGRRNGLKIRFREKRSMGSNPIIGTSKMAILLGNSLGFPVFVDHETVAHGNARKHRLFGKYSSSESNSLPGMSAAKGIVQLLQFCLEARVAFCRR